MGMQLPKYTVQISDISTLKAEIELIHKHWEESARNKELMILNPDYDRYNLMENQNITVCLAAYCDDKLVGYSLNLVQNHLHYATLLCGYNDLIFVDPLHRNSPLGIKLIKETKKALKARGVKLVLWHAKENTSLSTLLPKMGCKVQEIIYSEEL